MPENRKQTTITRIMGVQTTFGLTSMSYIGPNWSKKGITMPSYASNVSSAGTTTITATSTSEWLRELTGAPSFRYPHQQGLSVADANAVISFLEAPTEDDESVSHGAAMVAAGMFESKVCRAIVGDKCRFDYSKVNPANDPATITSGLSLDWIDTTEASGKARLEKAKVPTPGQPNGFAMWEKDHRGEVVDFRKDSSCSGYDGWLATIMLEMEQLGATAHQLAETFPEPRVNLFATWLEACKFTKLGNVYSFPNRAQRSLRTTAYRMAERFEWLEQSYGSATISDNSDSRRPELQQNRPIVEDTDATIIDEKVAETACSEQLKLSIAEIRQARSTAGRQRKGNAALRKIEKIAGLNYATKESACQLLIEEMQSQA